MLSRKCLALIVLVVVVLVALAGCGSDASGPADYSISDSWVISAMNLGAANPDQYVSTYNNKIVEVQGIMGTPMANGFTNSPGATVLGVRSGGTITWCIFDSGNTGDLNNYLQYDHIVVHGYYVATHNILDDYCVVRNVAFGPKLIHCRVISSN